MAGIKESAILTDFLDHFKLKSSQWVAWYRTKVGPMNYRNKGIFFSEGFAFCVMCRMLEVEMIVESGILYGVSTEIFARCFDIPIYSIDSCKKGIEVIKETQKRLHPYAHLNVILGDSRNEIPLLLKKYKSRKAGIFIDGPKGEKAIDLARQCLKFPQVQFVGIHDMGEMAGRHLMNEMAEVLFYTDEPWFRDTFGFLDEHVSQRGKYPDGPGIGFAANTELLRRSHANG